MKSGDLAKLPREILDRFEEFKNTTVLSFQDIDDLEAKVEEIVIPGPKKLSVFRAGFHGQSPDHQGRGRGDRRSLPGLCQDLGLNRLVRQVEPRSKLRIWQLPSRS